MFSLLLNLQKNGFAQSSVDVRLNIDYCNYNSVCEPPLENYLNCPSDCQSPSPLPVTPPPLGGGLFVDFPLLKISDLKFEPTTNSIRVSWKTNEETLGLVEWGKTFNTELGSISTLNFSNEHSVLITNLESDQIYRLVIKSTRTGGITQGFTGYEVRTLALPDTEPPANVSNFKVFAESNGVKLTWDNPKDLDFANVRIVRSEKFFSDNPDDGMVVYEGRGTNAFDPSVVEEKTYYYTAFSKDKSGNYSSGSIAVITIPKTVVGEERPPVVVSGDPFAGFPKALETDPIIKKLELSDFDFLQGGVKLPYFEDSVEIIGGKSLKILLAYEKVPEILKTIGVTLHHPSDKEKIFSFLLRVNEEKTAYEAIIGGLEESGRYGLSVTILDHKNQAVRNLTGAMVVKSLGIVSEYYIEKSGIIGFIFRNIILLLIFITSIYFISRKLIKNQPRRGTV